MFIEACNDKSKEIHMNRRGAADVRETRSASIEWMKRPSGILRVHPENGVYGDPYDWCCTVETIDDEVMLHGTMTAPTPSQFRAIMAALRSSGFKNVRWLRMGRREVRWTP